jgi:hypothetical protein
MKFFVFALAILAASAASSRTVVVDGTDAVYGAGLTGNGVSTAPVSVSFARGAGQFLRFSSVTGATNCCSQAPNSGPDGTFSGGTNVTALNGLSGISGPSQMFLAAVFINSNKLPVAGNEPASRSYDVADIARRKFRTRTNQVFFIGDGLTGTGTGTAQKFVIPKFADTVLFGFVDSFSFGGTPSFYGDNTGALTASFRIRTAVAAPAVPVPQIPLPAGLPLMAAGLLALLGLRRLRG